MISVYYDTGVILPLYIDEIFSETVIAFVETRHEPISFNLLQQMEMETAIRMKLFRGEIGDIIMRKIITCRDEDVRVGRLAFRPVNWILMMEDARRIGDLATKQWGCRTLDLLHVAIALQWRCTMFVTADDRQIKAARSAGLETVDIRKLAEKNRQDNAGASAPTSAVRERRSIYGKQADTPRLKRRGHKLDCYGKT